MADSNTVTTEFKTKGADKAASDAKKVSNAIKESGEAGKSASAKASGAFGSIRQAVNAASGAVRSFTRTLGLIGFAISAIEKAIAAFQAVQAWLKKDEEEAKRLNEEAAKNAVAKAATEAAAAVENLNEKLRASVALERERNKIADETRKKERAIEDAKLESDMANELAALDPNDPDYAAKQSLVRNKYARIKSSNQARRAQEDASEASRRNHEAVEAKRREARELDDLLKGEVGDASVKAKTRYYDLRDKAAKGDEKAKESLPEAQREFEDALKKAVDVKKRRDAASEEADRLQREGANLGTDMAAQIRNAATQRSLDMQDRDTRIGMAKAAEERKKREEEERKTEEEKRQKKEAEEAKRASALAAIDPLKMEKVGLQGAIEAAEQDKANAAQRVFEAQNAYNLARQNGDRRGASAAYGNLQAAQSAATEVNQSADKTINAMTAALKDVTKRLEAAQRYLEKASEQQSYAWSESPAGD